MKMYLNSKATEPIDVNSYSRYLDVPDQDVRFRLELNFSGDYSAEGVEYLANYANTLITDIVIEDENGVAILTSSGIKAKLTALQENCSEESRYGNASISIYEANANI